MTRYGVCPSYANWPSRLPLFADPMRRGRMFEVFKENGTPTGDPSPLGPDGWPVDNGQWQGVRLFGDMGGTMPTLVLPSSLPSTMRFRQNPGESAFLSWRVKPTSADLAKLRLKPSLSHWHLPSLEALAYFKPKILRTLDYGYQARKEKCPDWTKPRVLPTDPLQGEEMALELQCDLANVMDCSLWWNAPPRFELSVTEYEERIEEMLTIIRDTAEKPPILEYGNELWNAGFPVHNWLRGFSSPSGPTWHADAATEISILKRVAVSVFPEPGILGQKPYWLFVGGHIGDPFVLDKILWALPFVPDVAGPAIYMQPLRDHQEKWKTAAALTQDQLRDSVMANMSSFRLRLDAHRNILKTHGVPYFGCYEIGQDMHARGDVYKKAALQAQREEWMADAYRAMRQMLIDAQVDIACWYSAATAQTLDRSFGLLEGTLDKAPALPKARAARGE